MATLTTQVINRAALAPTYASAAGGGDKFTPGSNVFLHVKNTNAATRDITVAATKDVLPDMPAPDVVETIPATTGDKMLGPFPAEMFAASDGLADIAWSASAGVTVAVLQLSQP